MYDRETQDCRLLDQDRHTLAGRAAFGPAPGVDYLEVNCKGDAAEQNRLCVYDRVNGKILKTVDSVYQAIASKEDCEDLCNNAPFKCRGYDFNDTGDNVCRLSHHSAHSLTQIEEPYLFIEDAVTYELSACYNVSIECHSGDMTAHVHTSSLFGGKLYARGSPEACVEDVEGELDFSITMGYDDAACGVENEAPGVYEAEVVIQHHDRIVTSDDLGLSLTCTYDLANKSVSNAVDLTVTGEIAPALYEEATVDSPNVIMRVEDAGGDDTKTAVVGDPLTMVFEIVDQRDSPYEIFVRDLVAVDGATDAQLVLIDSRGCPADPAIMSALRKSRESNKTLESDFDAFRFPTSQVVQFRALVTPCMPTCEPVECEIRDYTGRTRVVESYGKRRKRDASSQLLDLMRHKRTAVEQPEELLVIKTIKIVDKAKRNRGHHEGGRKELEPPRRAVLDDLGGSGVRPALAAGGGELTVTDEVRRAEYEVERGIGGGSREDRCVDDTTLLAGGLVFLVAQFLLLVLWTLVWRRRRSQMAKEVILPEGSSSTSSSCGASSISGFSSSSRLQRHHSGSAGGGRNASTESLSYIYDAGIPRRLN